jgi:multiple sugar transport system substrate-binding protein
MISNGRISRRGVLAGLAAASVPASARAQDARTVRIWTFLDPASGKDPREIVFRKLIDQFEAANPGVKISVEPQNWTQMTDKFFAAQQTGTAPDIMWVIYNRLEAAVTLGALAGLDELFARNKLWTQADYDDMGGPYLQFGARGGTHYQIAHSRSIAGMFYRVDLFKQAGIDPSDVTTWDEFIAAAQKLTVRDADGNVTRWGFGEVFTNVANQPSIAASVMMDRDGKIFDDKGRAIWATPAGIEGLTLEVDMVRKYKVTPPTALSLNGEDIYDQFAAGHMAMTLSNTGRVARMQAIMAADKVSFLPFPSFTRGKALRRRHRAGRWRCGRAANSKTWRRSPLPISSARKPTP